MSGIKKIAVIVGHGNGDSGALGWNGVEEFRFNSEVAEAIKDRTNKQIQVFYRTSSGIKGVATRAMAWNPDMTLELHLNAFNGKAKGCEVLTLKDKASVDIGKSFSSTFCKKFNRILRDEDGVVELEKKDRGYFSLKCLDDPAPSILVEPFFIDNKEEWIEPKDYAEFLIGWINELSV